MKTHLLEGMFENKEKHKNGKCVFFTYPPPTLLDEKKEQKNKMKMPKNPRA